MSVHVVIEILKGLAWLGENFPDNPRLGRKLLLGGVALVSLIFVPDKSAELEDLILIVKSLSTISGGVLLILGSFIFFRRWVWNRQEKRQPIVTTLHLK